MLRPLANRILDSGGGSFEIKLLQLDSAGDWEKQSHHHHKILRFFLMKQDIGHFYEHIIIH
jgi:hypothetical protein